MKREKERGEGGRGRLGGKLAMVVGLGAILVLGGASTRNAGAGSSATTRIETPSAASGEAMHWADADRDTLDLQLD